MAILSNISKLLQGVDIDTLLDEIKSLKSQVASEKSKKKQLDIANKKLEANIEEINRRNESLKDDLVREDNKYKLLEVNLSSLQSSNIELATENKILTQNAKKLKENIDRANNSISSLNGKNLSLSNKTKTLETQLLSKGQLCKNQENEITTLKGQLANLEKSHEKITESLGKIQRESDCLNQQLMEKSNHVDKMRSIIEKLQDTNNGNNIKINNLENDVKKLKNESKSNEENVLHLKNVIVELEATQKELEESKKKHIQSLTEKYNSEKENNEQLVIKIQELQTAIHSIESENTSLKSANKFLEKKLYKLEEENKEFIPYIPLIEEKKKEEIERQLKEIKDLLAETIKEAETQLYSFCYDETINELAQKITSAKEILESSNNVEEIKACTQNVEETITLTKEKERHLAEEEKRQLGKAKLLLEDVIKKAEIQLSSFCHDDLINELTQEIAVAKDILEDSKNIQEIKEITKNTEEKILLTLKKEKSLIEEEKTKEENKKQLEENKLRLEGTIKKAEEQLSYFSHKDATNTLTLEISAAKELLNGNYNVEEIEFFIKSIEKAARAAEELNNIMTTEKNNSSKGSDDFDDSSLPYLFDQELVPAEKLSIPKVYDVKEEKIIDAKEFFAQNENELILWRRSLQEDYLMGHSRLICPECKQPVKISGHKLARGRVCYFSHFKDSNDCPYKTGTNRTKEEIERQKYSLIQESERHKFLKAAIAEALKGHRSKEIGVNNVECEKRINSDIPYLNWRRPDIYAEYNGRKFVFELQLSTTFVSVVVDRDIFYRLNDYNIIWVFNFEDNIEYVNLQNLMCKDIYYANKRNVFIFDTDTQKKSKELGELILKCRWLNENNEWTKDKYVSLDMFKYDIQNNKPYIYDADKMYLEKYPECAERRIQLEHSREFLLKGLMERQKHEEENERKKEKERFDVQQRLFENDKSVERFKSGTKYGYQYKGTLLIPAKYTSAENIREDGYAQVGFNRKIGLVRKDGKEVVPVEYRDIDIINAQHGIVMASYKKIDIWLGDEHISLCEEFDDKNQSIIKEENNGKLNIILQTSTYSYSYTSSYYGDHPICHKNFSGYSKSILFTLEIVEKEFCVVSIFGVKYFLSKNRMKIIGKNFSDIKQIGFDQFFITQDSRTSLWGVIDSSGNILTEFKYANLIPTGTEYLIAEHSPSNKIYGVIDYQGREFITPKFEAIFYLNSQRFAFREGNLWGVCNQLGQIVHNAEYTCIKVIESESFGGSTLPSYLSRWNVEDCIPSYNEGELKLCLLNENGEISYNEKTVGKYYIRHSGDLFSILSTNNVEFIDYSLLQVDFITETIAIIKSIDGKSGFFHDDECIYFDDCKNIEHLCDGMFKFENMYGYTALGTILGPLSEYSYSGIAPIDLHHYIVSSKPQWNISENYYIMNKEGHIISKAFNSINEFINGYAEAVFEGHKGIINIDGIMQENIIGEYDKYTLYEKFGSYYFRDIENKNATYIFIEISHIVNEFFIVKMPNESRLRLFSLKLDKTTKDNFTNIQHLTGNIFVTETQNVSSYYLYQNKYRLYRDLEPIFPESYCMINLLDNGYIALQKNIGDIYNSKIVWSLARIDGTILNDKEYDAILETNEDSFKVVFNGNEGYIDISGNAIIEKSPCGDNFVKTKSFGVYGLEDNLGNVILSLDEHFTCLELINEHRIIVCKEDKYAMFDLTGKQLTEFKYSEIICREDNVILATRNNAKGALDENGNEIANIVRFKGGYLQLMFEENSVISDTNQIIFPTGYTKIELLDSNGVFALWKGGKVSIGNIHQQKTNLIYKTVKAIGEGFFVVSRTISRKKRVRKTGYGYRGNPYTYYTSSYIDETKYGIINTSMQEIVRCKYSAISDFDEKQDITITKSDGEKKSISLAKLKQKSSNVLILSEGNDNEAKVQSFMAIGLIVKIKGHSFIIHKRYLFKPMKAFNKGERFIAKFLGNDNNGYPNWETMILTDNNTN